MSTIMTPPSRPLALQTAPCLHELVTATLLSLLYTQLLSLWHSLTLPRWQWAKLNCAKRSKLGKKYVLLTSHNHPLPLPLCNLVTFLKELKWRVILQWGGRPRENLPFGSLKHFIYWTHFQFDLCQDLWGGSLRLWPKAISHLKMESLQLPHIALTFYKRFSHTVQFSLSQHHIYFLVHLRGHCQS